jgi:hypothetical protein
MRRYALGWLRAAALIAAASPALAAAADSGPPCFERTLATADTELRLGRVTGAGRAYLLLDGVPCPGPDAACRNLPFAEPGQWLLLGRSRPGYVCAFAAGRIPGNVGWIPLARLAPATQPVDPTPPLHSWIGTWREGDNRIALSLEGDRISAEGDAYWPGKNIMPGNEGSFAGTAAPSANRLRIVENSCEVGMTLAGRFLAVTDNQMCGGHNVSFSGIFVRRRDRLR